MDRRVFSPDDFETDVTPRDIRDYGLDEQVNFMDQWFRALFEDPQNEMPYAEPDEPYNYRYLWGGPYDAAEELWGNFESLASKEAIEQAIEYVQRDGIIEWAPTSNHPDRRAAEEEVIEEYEYDPPSLEEVKKRFEYGTKPQFGNGYELQLRAEVQKRIEELRSLKAESKNTHGGIGHNNPPDETGLPPEMTSDALQAVEEIDQQLKTSLPNTDKVINSASRIETALKWMANKADMAVDAFLKAFSTTAGTLLAGTVISIPFWGKIADIFRSTLEWLNHISLPF